jgi:hypothetical protein
MGMMLALALVGQADVQSWQDACNGRLAAIEKRLSALESLVQQPTVIPYSKSEPKTGYKAVESAPVQTTPFLYNVGDSVMNPTGPDAARFYSLGGWDGRTFGPPTTYAPPVVYQQPVYQPMSYPMPMMRMMGGSCANGRCR